MLDQLSEELREAREQKNLTLEQMASKTRIDIKFLEAIDKGNFSFLPELYVKAFLKQYAKTVDLDENEVIQKYELAKEGKFFQKPEQHAGNSEPIYKPEQKKLTPLYDDSRKEKHTSSTNENRKHILLGLIGLVFFAAAALVYFLVIKNDQNIIVEETPYEEVLEDNTQRYVEEPQSEFADSLPGVLSSDSLYMRISTSDKSWIQVIMDGNTNEEYTLESGTSKTFTAGSAFRVTVGNAGGISVMLNNIPVDFTGRKGEVRVFKLDRNGLEYISSIPKTPASDDSL